MMIGTTNAAGNVSAKPEQSSSLSRGGTFPACGHCYCCCPWRWRHGQLHVSPAGAPDSRVSVHRLRVVRALLHSGREQALFERVRVPAPRQRRLAPDVAASD
jgi:epoxyqueuosine reductase QueG